MTNNEYLGDIFQETRFIFNSASVLRSEGTTIRIGSNEEAEDRVWVMTKEILYLEDHLDKLKKYIGYYYGEWNDEGREVGKGKTAH